MIGPKGGGVIAVTQPVALVSVRARRPNRLLPAAAAAASSRTAPMLSDRAGRLENLLASSGGQTAQSSCSDVFSLLLSFIGQAPVPHCNYTSRKFSNIRFEYRKFSSFPGSRAELGCIRKT